MKATRIVITDHVVAPSSQPSIRDQTTSSIKPEAPEATNEDADSEMGAQAAWWPRSGKGWRRSSDA